MLSRLARLHPRQRWLLVAFVLVAGVTVAFGTRAVVSAIYWQQHRDEPIEAWMTIGYVAHSHRVSPTVLQRALDLPPGAPDRRPLGEIAASRGATTADLAGTLMAVIEAERTPQVPPEGGDP